MTVPDAEKKAKKIICVRTHALLKIYTQQTGRALQSVIHHSCG